jgi:hypothetical protein
MTLMRGQHVIDAPGARATSKMSAQDCERAAAYGTSVKPFDRDLAEALAWQGSPDSC